LSRDRILIGRAYKRIASRDKITGLSENSVPPLPINDPAPLIVFVNPEPITE
jgi:hypothetical protein